MSEQEKPRVWHIGIGEGIYSDSICSENSSFKHIVKVVEIKALEQAQAEIEKLKGALDAVRERGCARCSNIASDALKIEGE